MNADYRQWLVTVRTSESSTRDYPVRAHSAWAAGAQLRQLHPPRPHHRYPPPTPMTFIIKRRPWLGRLVRAPWLFWRVFVIARKASLRDRALLAWSSVRFLLR